MKKVKEHLAAARKHFQKQREHNSNAQLIINNHFPFYGFYGVDLGTGIDLFCKN